MQIRILTKTLLVNLLCRAFSPFYSDSTCQNCQKSNAYVPSFFSGMLLSSSGSTANIAHIIIICHLHTAHQSILRNETMMRLTHPPAPLRPGPWTEAAAVAHSGRPTLYAEINCGRVAIGHHKLRTRAMRAGRGSAGTRLPASIAVGAVAGCWAAAEGAYGRATGRRCRVRRQSGWTCGREPAATRRIFGHTTRSEGGRDPIEIHTINKCE